MRLGQRHIYWSPWHDPGLEHLHLELGEAGVMATGLVLRMCAGAHLRCRYELEADADWHARSLTFAVADSGSGENRRVKLESDGEGAWRIDGAAAPALDGCIDLDIQATPFTNSLAIRRLALDTGESADLRVAYLAVPDLAVRPVEQRYTCLEALGSEGGEIRYEGPFRGFSAELAIDGDGLVLDYPETFRRVWPR